VKLAELSLAADHPRRHAIPVAVAVAITVAHGLASGPTSASLASALASGMHTNSFRYTKCTQPTVGIEEYLNLG
jgi:hypothetical protein